MILLLVVPAWILILSLVVGLCMAAGAGDRQKQTQSPRSSSKETAWVK